MKLISLRMGNFKGIKNQEFLFVGKNATIYGGNATGKTTTLDAWLWLLFEKDSEGSTKFGVKTITNGEIIHGLEHSVEGIIEHEEKTVKLKKVLQEKWTKKRGSVEKEFTGNTIYYYIDDVPAKKKEYVEQIKDLVGDENIFRLITDLKYFNTDMKWKDRRKLLIDVCGDVDNQEIYGKNEMFNAISEILKNRTVEKHMETLKASRKKLNEDLEKIPVRIDEVAKSIEDFEAVNIEEVQATIDSHEKNVSDLKTNISDLKNGSFVSKKRKEIAEIETEMIKAKNEHEQDATASIKPLADKVETWRPSVLRITEVIERRKSEIKIKENSFKIFNDSRETLRKEWGAENAKTFEYNGTCPTCKQDLPEEDRQKALENFNVNKSKTLEEIQTTGKSKKVEAERLEKEIHEIKLRLGVNEVELKTHKENLEKAKEAVKNHKFVELDNSPYTTKITDLNNDIENHENAHLEEVVKLESQIDSIELTTKEEKEKIYSQNKFETAKARIKELESEKKIIAEKYQELEKEIYTVEEFTKLKVELMDHKINSKFKFAKFQLFKTLVNGSLEECCETMYNDIPYSDLNNAARINVGLDIINTFSKHYGITAPIFIDNAESVVEIEKTEGQQIKLVVSREDKKLRMEI